MEHHIQTRAKNYIRRGCIHEIALSSLPKVSPVNIIREVTEVNPDVKSFRNGVSARHKLIRMKVRQCDNTSLRGLADPVCRASWKTSRPSDRSQFAGYKDKEATIQKGEVVSSPSYKCTGRWLNEIIKWVYRCWAHATCKKFESAARYSYMPYHFTNRSKLFLSPLWSTTYRKININVNNGGWCNYCNGKQITQI
jgi:hypothetical protein